MILGLFVVLFIVGVAVATVTIHVSGYRIVNRRRVRFKRGYNTLVSNKKLPPLYKIVRAIDGAPINGGSGGWDRPDDDGPGEWRFEKLVEACRSGLHVTDKYSAESWCIGNKITLAIYRVEVDGPAIRADSKYVASRVRLLYPVYVGMYNKVWGPNIMRAIETGERLWANRESKEAVNA